MIKSVNYTPAELKQAQTIISDYLFTNLLQSEVGTKIRLGSVGWLIKKARRVRNGLGNFVYYHCDFKKSAPLKRALDEQVEDHE